MIGTTFSRYLITAKLGEGGMGAVWLAEDTLLGRPVALKFLASHLADSESARHRFVREARAASRLEHSGIASVFDAGEAGGQVFIAYQFVEGETLARRLVAGPLAWPELVRLASGCAEALAHAHGRQVLHRDLTAGNVMLRPDGSPVIVDFGLARMRDDVTHTATVATLGTVPYIAPEQWRGEAGEARTDLWSLGVVLYLAATGQQPFGGDSPQAVMYRVLNENPVRPMKLRPELPGEFEQLVLRLLEKDARDRPASAAQLAAVMQGLPGVEVQEAALPISGEGRLEQLRRWWRRQVRRVFTPAQVALLLVAGLALAAGGAYLARQQIDRPELVLAVLPFRNASADPLDTGYIGEALGSQLTARLGRKGGFRVLPWETTARFADSKRSFTELARDLGADLLLVGYYDGNDERISVGLELVEGRKGHQLWSDRLQGTARDLAHMESDIAGRITRQLAPSAGKSGGRDASTTMVQSPEAYETYLRGLNALHASSLADQALAEPMFRRALELDSTFADAWVGLGAVLLNRYYVGGHGGVANLARGQGCFERALSYDPVSGPAIRGLLRTMSESENSDLRVLALADSLGPLVADEVERQLVRGWACFSYNLPEEAADAFERVLVLDSHNQAARYVSCFNLWWAGRQPEAVESCKAYLREFGEDPDVYAYCGAALAAMARYDEARVFLGRSVQLFTGSRGAWAVLYYSGVLRSSGRGAAADSLLDEKIPESEAALEAAPDNLRLRTDLANLYAARGDMHGFETQWSIVVREIGVGARGSGGEYPYTPFVLAQRGHLERARRIVADFPQGAHQFMVLLPANVGLEHMFRGGRSAEFASSPELFQARAAVQAYRATMRKSYRWLAGSLVESAP